MNSKLSDAIGTWPHLAGKKLIDTHTFCENVIDIKSLTATLFYSTTMYN